MTVWPHEVGHSLVAYLFGCKSNWWQTDISWFLWGSRGGAIDYGCLRARGGTALGLVEFSGIAVNIMLLALSAIVGRWWRAHLPASRSQYPWLFLATFLWALANYAEAFSYLVLNTIWLKSDMLDVVTESGVSRWIWLSGGALSAALIARLLWQPAWRAAAILAASSGSRRLWLVSFALYVAVVSMVMAAARIVLT